MNEQNTGLEDVIAGFDKLGDIVLPSPEAMTGTTEMQRTFIPSGILQVCQQGISPEYTMSENKVNSRIGKRVAPDIEMANKMCLYEGKAETPKKTDFLMPILEKAMRIIINLKNGVEVWYRIFKKQYYYIPADEAEQSFYVPQKSLMKTAEIFKCLSENGIVITYTGRDVRQLLETFINGITISSIEYPYKAGWNCGKFMYNENGLIHKFADTPFLTKKLITDGNISQKIAFDAVVKQLLLIKNKTFRLFIFLLMHLSLLKDRISKEFDLDLIFVIYGDMRFLNKIGYLFFQFYNRNKKEVHFLYDKNILDKLEKCKDEVFVISDKYPETKYKRECAENNLSDVKDLAFKGECDGFCLITSDCGITETDDELFNMTVFQKDIEETENIREALGTHIKHFVGWVEKNSELYKKSSYIDTVFRERNRGNLYGALCVTFEIMDKYSAYIGGENIAKVLGYQTEKTVYYHIQQLIHKGFLYYQGEWICEHFKEVFFELNLKRVRDKEQYVDFYGNEPFVYLTSQYVCFRRKDITLFLKHFPTGMRELDILKTLKKYGWLSTDNEKRCEKTVWFKKKHQKMIAVNKEFLFPVGSVEGGI